MSDGRLGQVGCPVCEKYIGVQMGGEWAEASEFAAKHHFYIRSLRTRFFAWVRKVRP